MADTDSEVGYLLKKQLKLGMPGYHAVVLMMALAQSQETKPVTVKTIAEITGLSASYLENLGGCLSGHRLIKSVRGIKGGYVLELPPEEISVGAIMMAVEKKGLSRYYEKKPRNTPKLPDNFAGPIEDLRTTIEQLHYAILRRISLAELMSGSLPRNLFLKKIIRP